MTSGGLGSRPRSPASSEALWPASDVELQAVAPGRLPELPVAATAQVRTKRDG